MEKPHRGSGGSDSACCERGVPAGVQDPAPVGAVPAGSTNQGATWEKGGGGGSGLWAIMGQLVMAWPECTV
jgi:hypothetical protein